MTETRNNIFGTDGIRDVGGEGLLTPGSVDRIGSALARHLEEVGHSAGRVLTARDPRTSGPLIEAQLTAALKREGKHPRSGGVLPTPAVSLLVASGEAELGVVLSASHNPPQYNGIKVVTATGRKLSVEEEISITAFYESEEDLSGENLPAVEEDPGAGERYLALLESGFPSAGFLEGMHIVLDCAHGATCQWAPEIFARADARTEPLHGEPDGLLINTGCGSVHPEDLSRQVLESGAQLGIAFDGAGDRATLVDEKGAVGDGDEAMVIWGLALLERGELVPPIVVCSVMSNAGMVAHLRENGIEVVQTPVGDRKVHETMVTRSAVLGGEQSGHIIDRRACPTGDGIRTGLAIAHRAKETGVGLSELRRGIPRFPQVLEGIEVTARPPIESLEILSRAIADGRETLGDRGRILVRYSGTEKLLRILVEGPQEAENQRLLDSLIEAARQQPALGCRTP